MIEKLYFKVESPENMVKLCATIEFEKSEHFKELGYLWRKVFNDEHGDELFRQFLEELFPNGATINLPEINKVMLRAIKYLRDDEQCQNIQVEYLKKKYHSWVFSKWNKKLIPCNFAEHAKIIKECVFEFFGDTDIETLTALQIKNFILSNFEIRSENSTVQMIANDATYIFRCLIFSEKVRLKNGN